MKALFSLLAVIMVLIVCRFNAGLAADFYDPASGVTLKSPEGYSVVDALDRSLDLGLQTPVRSYYLLGRGQVSAQTAEIHYLVSDEPASVLLAELQLRIIDAILRKNRRLLDRDAVELQGVSFANQLPMRALVLPGREVTVAVLAVGNDFAFYEQFLLDLSDRIPFGDTRDHPFSAEIHDVASRGIFRGYSSATGGIPTFRPDFGINRAELMKVVVLSSPGVDQQEVDEFVSEGSMKRIFPDVEVGSWYEPYVYYAYEQGWIAGYPDGNFRPLSIVNIAEAAKIILSSKNVSTVNSSGPWYQPYVQYLLEKNIFQLSSAGYAFSFSDDGFPAHSEASRAQIAAFLSRLIFISEHQSLPVYARLTESSLLAFQLTSETPLEVYDLGNAVHGPYHNVYSLFVRDGQGLNPVMDLALIEPDVWSQLDIAEAPTDLPAMTYLAEDGHFVIAVFDSCLFQKPCLQATARQLSETLVVSNQMLSSFRDPNSSYSFLHPPNFRVRFQSSASEQTAIITSEAGREHMILSLLPGRAGEIGTFQGLSPVESRKLGKRDWVIYHQQASVLLLSVVSSRDLLVAQIPLESTGVRLDPLLYQILRTVREK